MYGDNMIFINNSVTQRAAVIYFDENAEKRLVSISNSWFEGNIAGVYSGTFFMNLIGDPDIHNYTFSNCTFLRN